MVPMTDAPDVQPVPLSRLADLPRDVLLYQGSAAGYVKRWGRPPAVGYTWKGRTWWVIESEGE